MKLDEFKNTMAKKDPPKGASDLLKALWIEARDDWDIAHRIVQVLYNRDAMWVHAYLHRKEGDLSNASYWYHRAEMPMTNLSLDKEWEDIAVSLLANS